MKKILLSTFLILFSISSAYATQFCEGFKAGYSTGYKQKKINFLNKILLVLSLAFLTACGTTYSHRSGDNTNLSLDSRSCQNQANILAPTYLCRNPLMCAPDETALVFNSIAQNNAVYDQCMLQKGYQPQ